jgi:DnaJ homolog subfamily A member 2
MRTFAYFISSGARGNAKPKECSNCEGHGFQYVQRSVRVLALPQLDHIFSLTVQMGGAVLGSTRIKCPSCEGKGTKIREKDRFALRRA